MATAGDAFSAPGLDLSGRTALITGASGGLGLEIARGIAAAGARVIMPVRNRAKGERAIARIAETVSHAQLELRDLDLARLDSVRALAQSLADEPVHVLVANAGVALVGDQHRHLTVDGYELQWQTNMLGHAVLTLCLLPALRAGHARVVAQLSLAAALAWGGGRRYRAFREYARSKAALGLFALELGRREPALRVSLCHPGISAATAIAPALRAKVPDGLLRAVAPRLGDSPAQAAQVALHALRVDAASTAFYGPSGPLQIAGPPRALSLYRSLTDRARAAQVWALAAQALAAGARG